MAFQFNRLQLDGSGSGDGSLLLPASGLDGEYVVVSWPQTIADTDDPVTDFGDDLRAFLTIVGTAPD